MRWLLLFAGLLASPAMAQTAPRAAWEGVWSGTVGTLPVRACFSQNSDTWAVGSYYYLRHMKAIPLRKRAGGSGGNWEEQNQSGANSTSNWAIRAAGNRLTGDWRSGTRRLAINLTRVPAGSAEDGPCGSDAFIAPRVRPVVERAAPKVQAGFAYSEVTHNVGPYWSGVDISTFAYPASQPGDRAINAALRVYPGKFESEADYLSCLKQSLSSGGLDGDFSFGQEPLFASRAFLSVIVTGGGSCGGAHPYHFLYHRAFDRASGQRIDLTSWLNLDAAVRRQSDEISELHQLTPEFRTEVVSRARDIEPDCREYVAAADYWDIALTGTGLEFTPSLAHVMAPCEEPIAVPFAALTRRLSAAGRAGVARIGR